MKKTILAMVLMGSGAAVMAQDSLSVNTNDMNNGNTTNAQMQRSTGNYPAYGNVSAPSAVQYNFNQQYPGTTGAQWQQTYNGYWRATYRQNNLPMNVYYADNGQSFTVALPVLQGAIPADVVSRAVDLYGNNLYDITLLRVADQNTYGTTNMNTSGSNMNGNTMNGSATGTTNMSNTTSNAGTTTAGMQNRYLVRVIENGMLRAERMNEDGTPDMTYSANNTTMQNGSNTMNNGNTTNWNNGTTNMNTTNNGTMNNTTGGTLNHSSNYSAYYGTTDGSTGSYYGTDLNTSNQGTGTNMNQSTNLNNSTNGTNSVNGMNQSNSGNMNSTTQPTKGTGTKNNTKKQTSTNKKSTGGNY